MAKRLTVALVLLGLASMTEMLGQSPTEFARPGVMPSPWHAMPLLERYSVPLLQVLALHPLSSAATLHWGRAWRVVLLRVYRRHRSR
ncbi:hypothetical protein L917_15379 [Phytophthora nicotianae]|uniref:RxLR effector protein n=1 Tax=Phytophthora nicotianae TaxID=4792 RepID=W2KIA4_PHYNI|nr:hypothetical protein L917_15379 [Phytophthora nicotianae]